MAKGTGHSLEATRCTGALRLPHSCSCSRERALAPLALFSDGELQEMMREGDTEVTCQFCGRKYQFSPDDLLGLTKVN